MSLDVLFAGIPVRDFDASRAWYDRLLGRPADVVANDTEVMWRIAEAAWLYVVKDLDRAGHALVALAVPHLEQAIAEVGDRGITSGPIEIVAHAGRKGTVTDPEGNTIIFVEGGALRLLSARLKAI